MREAILNRITLNPEVSGGKPSIRNMRFTVTDLLHLLASGMSHEEIWKDFPYLEEDDIRACLLYAAKIADTKTILQEPDQ